MADLSLKEIAVLDDVTARPELKTYFFGKINKAKWFDALKERGYFDSNEIPRPVNVKDQYFNIPNWPVTEYLVNSSKTLSDEMDFEFAQKIWIVVKDVTYFAREQKFGNNRVWWQFSKIIRNLPLELIQEEYSEIVEYWLSDNFGADLAGDELLSWLLELLDSSNQLSLEFAKNLMSFIYSIKIVDKKYSENGRKEAKLIYRSYHFKNKGPAIATKAGKVLGETALEFFQSKMEEILKIEENDKWSCVWRSAIENHAQNHKHRTEEASYVILEAFRDALVSYLARSDNNKINESISVLLENEYQTIQRIAIYVGSENFRNLNDGTIDKLLNSEFFNENYRHEMWHLLQNNFSGFSDELRSTTIEIIQSLVGRHDEDEEISEKRTAYYQSLWLASIKDVDSKANELYQACIALTGEEPDHPDFSSYMTSGSVTHESPTSIEELYEKLSTPRAMVDFLNDYEYQGHFNEPGLEGLTKAFGGLVLKEPSIIADSFDVLASLKPHYLHELYSAFSSLWDQKSELNWIEIWPKLLAFSNQLFSAELFWNYADEAPGGAFIGSRNWVVGDVARLIEAGCKNDEYAFALDNIDMAKSTLEIILNKQQGEIFKQESDAVSIAINSPRGRCIEAYINLALYHCRTSSEEDKSVIADSYKALFELELTKDESSESQYEFMTLFANYFPNFLYLLRDWSLSNIPKIFDKTNTLRWMCAVQGFSYVGHIVPEVYNHLKNNGDFSAILDNEELKERTDDRYINLIVLAYFHKEESVEDEGSLISLLLNRSKEREIQHLIWFIWTLKNPVNLQRVKEMVYELFPRILDQLDVETEAGQKLASQLCHWAIFLDDLDEDKKSWLLQISQYAEVDYNSTYLMEALAKLSATYPIETFDIWSNLLARYASDYPPEEIKTIFKNLIASGIQGHRNAKDIADLYLTHGLNRPRELLLEAKNEVDNP